LALWFFALLQGFLQLAHDHFEVGNLIRLDEIEHHAAVVREDAGSGRLLGTLRRRSGLLRPHHRGRQQHDEKSNSNPGGPAPVYRPSDGSKHHGLLDQKGATLTYSVEQTLGISV